MVLFIGLRSLEFTILRYVHAEFAERVKKTKIVLCVVLGSSAV
jgi:hypothetical protein